MIKRKNEYTHDRVDLLLPWFVNETLSDAERAHVQKHLADCQECKASVSLLTTMRTEVRNPAATPIVPKPDTSKLLALIEQKSVMPNLRNGRHYMLAASAMFLVLTVTTVLITGRLTSSEAPTEYLTATTSQAPGRSMDYVLGLQFELSVDKSTRDNVLRKIDAKDVSTDDSSGFYRVVVRLPIDSLEELENYAESLSAIPEIHSANIVALQLPVIQD